MGERLALSKLVYQKYLNEQVLDVKTSKKCYQLCILNLADSPEPLTHSVFLQVLMGSPQRGKQFQGRAVSERLVGWVLWNPPKGPDHVPLGVDNGLRCYKREPVTEEWPSPSRAQVSMFPAWPEVSFLENVFIQPSKNIKKRNKSLPTPKCFSPQL